MTDNEKGWHLNVKSQLQVPIASFVRLFIIRRVLKTSKQPIDADNISQVIKVLDTNCNDCKSNKDRDSATKIVSQLVRHGIKNYMANNFNENEQATMIERVFQEIILKKFGKEYENITKYKETRSRTNTTKNDYFKIELFNMNDLMCLIFQYLNYNNGELFNCSLVNSYWLYHSYNPNCIYSVNLTKLIKRLIFVNNHVNQNDNCKKQLLSFRLATAWQHVINAKMISFKLPKKCDIGNDLLEKLCLFNNIQSIEAVLKEKQISVLKAILLNCANKIEYYHVRINGCEKRRWTLWPLTLNSGKYIFQNRLNFGIKWSNKCHTFIFNGRGINSVGIKWCQFIINNCDCTGIKLLHLDKFRLSLDFENYNYNSGDNCKNNSISKSESKFNDKKDSKLKLLNKLALKFANLKHLKICWRSDFYDNSCELLFWEALAPIIDKNNVFVELTTPRPTHPKYYQLVGKMDKSKRKIHKLIVGIDDEWTNRYFDDAKTIINDNNGINLKPDLQWIKIDNYQYKGNGIEKFGNRLIQMIESGDINLKSLKVIEVSDVNHVGARSTQASIVSFCKSKLFCTMRDKLLSPCFFIANFSLVNVDVSSFETISYHVLSLIAIIPIDICIILDEINKEKFDTFEKSFQSYLSKHDLQQRFDYHQLSKRYENNQFCIVLKHVKVSFIYQVTSDSIEQGVLRVATAQHVDFDVFSCKLR